MAMMGRLGVLKVLNTSTFAKTNRKPNKQINRQENEKESVGELNSTYLIWNISRPIIDVLLKMIHYVDLFLLIILILVFLSDSQFSIVSVIKRVESECNYFAL